jgi:transposase
MIKIQKGVPLLLGAKGSLPVREDDEITLKLAMLFEGECEGLGPAQAAKKFDYTRQRYYQILGQFMDQGAAGLKSLKPGPKANYRRTDEVIRQIIRYRFLDPKMSPEVIAQKLNQNGYPIAHRSVERVISEYGLQKKTPSLSSRQRTGPDRDPSDQREGASGVKRSR